MTIEVDEQKPRKGDQPAKNQKNVNLIHAYPLAFKIMIDPTQQNPETTKPVSNFATLNLP